MPPISDGHLSTEEVLQALISGQIPTHAKECAICGEEINAFRGAVEASGEPPAPSSTAPGECLSDEALIEIATGASYENYCLSHLNNCPICLERLALTTKTLARELTEAEKRTIETLPSADPAWQRDLAVRLCADHKLARRRRLLRVIAATAAGIALFAGSWWLVRFFRDGRTDSLLATAFTEMRPFEYRLPDRGYQPPRAVRSADQSPLSKPDSLLRAEASIASGLRNNPDNPAWLRWKGQAELIELSPDSAIRSLKSAQKSDSQSGELITDLAIAYALRGEMQNRPVDFAFALDLLTAQVNKTPQNPRARFNRALIYERLRMNDEAVNEWKEFLKLDSRSGWAEEGRRRLKDLQERKSSRDEQRKNLQEDPRRFMARAGPPPHMDGYLENTVIEWLSKSRNDPTARQALLRLAPLVSHDLGDHWLADAIEEANGRASPALLLSIVKANQQGKAETALGLAKSGVSEFSRNGQVALGLRARFEEAYAMHRNLQPEECSAAARAIQPELARRSYHWLEIQSRLEGAVCDALRGREGDAIASLQDTKELADRYGLQSLALRASGLLANVRIVAGDPWSAWGDCIAGLDQYWQAGYPANRAHQFFFNLASAADHLELRSAAFAFGSAAMDQLAQTDNRPTEALGDARVGAMALRAGLPDEASRFFERAANISAALEPSETVRRYQIDALLARAQADVDRGDLNTAARELHSLDAQPPNTPEVFIVGFRRELVYGEVALRSADYKAAERHLSQAMSFADLRMRELHSPVERLRALEETSRAPRLLMEAMLKSGRDPADALNLWLRFRSSSSGQEHGKGNREAVARLVYVVLSGKIAAWDLRGDRVRFLWLPADSMTTARRGEMLLDLLASRDSNAAAIESLSRTLFHDLVAPFGLDLGIFDVLQINTDAALSTVPFGLLMTDNGQFLGDRVPVVFSHDSGSEAQESRVTANNRIMVIANPSAGSMLTGTLPYLPDVLREGRSIAQSFEHPMVLLDNEANLKELNQRLPLADAVHFAGHGFSNNGNGGLVLADGLLTSRQILLQSWKRCRLVVLSACLTATGERQGPANPESLIRALRTAGARTVVASQWSVDSAASRAYMGAFYDALMANQSVPAAIRSAQRSLRSKEMYRHPYYWGAFQAFE